MAIYEITADSLRRIEETSFHAAGVRERGDLQRLLRGQIEVIAKDTLIITEEFGEWEDSRRRIDLLGLDRDANLVVFELKRTVDGGHMELQAIRYAAMVSTMTFEQVVEVHDAYLRRTGSDADARSAILEFLDWEEPDEDRFAQDVRIVLVSAEFSKEITTAVMWLNEQGLDIRCIRIRPYTDNGRVLVDVQQVIPLPEAEEYMVRVRAKEQEQRASHWRPKDMATIWREFEQRCSPEVLAVARRLHDWLRDRADEIFPTTNSFGPKLLSSHANQYLFKVKYDGIVQMWFHTLSQRPPFSDEALRRELMRRLNQIPGVAITDDRLAGKPRFSLGLLQPEAAFHQFTGTVEWMIGTIRQYESSTQSLDRAFP